MLKQQHRSGQPVSDVTLRNAYVGEPARSVQRQTTMRLPSQPQIVHRLLRSALLFFVIAFFASACQADTEPLTDQTSEVDERDRQSEIEDGTLLVSPPPPPEPVPLNRIDPFFILDGREVAEKLQVDERDLTNWVVFDDEDELLEFANLVAEPESKRWNRLVNTGLERSFVVAVNSNVCEHTDAYLLTVDGELHYTIVDGGADCGEPNFQFSIFIVWERYGHSESTIVRTIVQEDWSDHEYFAPVRPNQNAILPTVFQSTNLALDADLFAAPQIISTDDERRALRNELGEFASAIDGLNPQVSWLLSVEKDCSPQYWVNAAESGLELVTTNPSPVACVADEQYLVIFELHKLLEPADPAAITTRKIESL